MSQLTVQPTSPENRKKSTPRLGRVNSVDVQSLWCGQNKAILCSCPGRWKHWWLLQRLPSKLRRPAHLFQSISPLFQKSQEEEVDARRHLTLTKGLEKNKQQQKKRGRKNNHSDTCVLMLGQFMTFSAQLAMFSIGGDCGGAHRFASTILMGPSEMLLMKQRAAYTIYG